MKKRILLLAVTLMLLVTCAVFAVSAAGDDTNAFEANFVCPCGCGKGFDEIEWRDWGNTSLSSPYSWTVTDHYWIDSTMNPGGSGTLTGTGTDGAKKIVVVFHDPSSAATYFGPKNTKTVRTFDVPAGTTAWLIGDNATVWGPGASNDKGGLIKVEAGATLYVDGIKLRQRTDGTNVPTDGGVIYNQGTLTMNDCTLTGFSVTGNGGAIWSSGKVTLSGSTTVQSGSAVQGGNIYMNGAELVMGTGVTVKNGVASTNGGNIALVYSSAAAKLTMTGGTISGGVSNGDGTVSDDAYYSEGYVPYLVDYVKGGGNIFVFRACVANISGGTVSGGTASACGGGNVFVQGTLNVSGDAKLTGGTAIKGGNIYAFDRNPCADADKDGKGDKNPNLYAYVNISGGEVTGGAAVGTADVTALGGTIYAYGGGKNQTNTTGLKITGGTVGGGTANGDKGGSGGAIYINNTVATLSGCTINGGTATQKKVGDTTYGGFGGAIYLPGGTVNMGANTTISGGTAYRGGCLNVAGTFNMNGGTISGGKSTNQGGLAFVTGTFNMTSGTATANTASTSNARGFRVQGGKMNMSGDAKVISANKGRGDGIDLLRTGSDTATGVLTLADQASVVGPNGELDNNIRVQNYSQKSSKLTITKDWTGQASAWYEYLFGTTYKSADYSVGMTIDKAFGVSTGDYTGTLLMEGAPTQPPLFAGENGTLQAAKVQLCTYNLPKLDAKWYKSGTEAAAAAEPGDYIGIFAAGTMDIGDKDVLVDFNGNDCTVTGTGKLYMMDAAGDNYDGTLAKITYNNVATSAINPANDRQYVALPNGDGTYSAHRVNLRISAVSVRPGSTGVYYTASMDCDDILRGHFAAAGVAVSLNAVPGFDYETNSLYTKVTQLEENQFTGVLINEILKDGENNDVRGNMTIYANAYADFTVDGQKVTVLADPYNVEKAKADFLPSHRYTAYSLNDVMQAIDLRWRKLDDKDRNNLLDKLYNAYDGVMQDWNLRFIDSYVTGKPVKSLKVLTIGNSLSVDAGHMLGYICKLEGMESVRISTLYYGGCTQQQHATFLTNNTPEYRWYDTNITDLQNTEDKDTVPIVSMLKKDQITMYEGITMDDWDIIVTQQGVWQAGMPETHEEDLDTVLAYVRKHATNPNAILMWNMNWAPPVEEEMLAKANNGIPPDASGFETSYKSMTGFEEVKNNKEAQNKMFELIRNTVQTKIVTNPEFIDVIPAATAQQNALWSGLFRSNWQL